VRRFVAIALALLTLLMGYAVLDIYDIVPGILTLDRPLPQTTKAQASRSRTARSASIVPTVDADAQPLKPASASAPIPGAAALRARLARALTDPALGPSVGVVLRDAFTGQSLLSVDPDRPRIAASTAKLLTALAVDTTLDPRASMPTTVLQGSSPSEIVLVAGGDTMLARGAGIPTAVEGHAGLADLAGQVASALEGAGTTSVTLRLDTTYAAGPRWAPGWNQADVSAGYTGGVSMLGLAGERARPGKPAPRDPEAAVASAFVVALKGLGITATPEPERAWSRPASVGAAVLGKVDSAPIGDVLSLALADSDNALTEGLARQATVKAGGPPTFPAAVAFVKKTVTALGVDLAGATLKDTSGLTAGQAVSAQTLSDALQLGADGSVASMEDTIAGLPVAGLSGTLHDRFLDRSTHAVAGIARAKTGTLGSEHASSMAGTLVDADGRVLSYVILADRIPTSAGTLGARAALDRLVAALATCGCR
jgi:serine-type D-Ala-D-Ala carboxypeptidase/endopeptidase (penicillin-binding protein 4)